MKRLAVVFTLLALSLSACGGVGHAVGGVVAHKALNHVVTSQKGQRNVNRGFCVYHGARLIIDLKHHHFVGAAINAEQAYKSCKAGFKQGSQ